MSLRLGSLLALVVVGLSVQSCTRVVDPKSALDTVNIPQTPARNQGAGSICWAYATASLVEAEALRKTGQEFDISEEAIAFYVQLEKLLEYSMYHSGADLPDAAAFATLLKQENEDLEGWFVRSSSMGSVPDGLGIIAKYGAVPERVWSKKFENWYSTGDEFREAVGERFVRLIKGRRAGELTPQQIIDEVLVGPGAYHSAPPSEFDVALPDGRQARMTAQKYAADVLKFNNADYVARTFRGVRQLGNLVNLTKLALAQGMTVSLSFGVDFELFDDKVNGFVARGRSDHQFKEGGGHAVLVTDFVNQGGSLGAMTAEQIKAEVARPHTELDYFVIKNSWGRDPQPNGISSRGLIIMDREYIEANLRAGRVLSLAFHRNATNSGAAVDVRAALQTPDMNSPFVQTCENPLGADAEKFRTVEAMSALVPGNDCREKWTRLYNLVELDLSGVALSNMEPLSGLTRLRALFLAKNTISDVSPLAGLTSLAELDLSFNAVSSIEAFRGLTKLESVNLAGNQVTSIEALSLATRLRELVASDNPIGSLAPLAGAIELGRLHLDRVPAQDLAALSSLNKLRELSMRSAGVSSVDGLAGLLELQRLDLSGNQVVDVGPLKGMQRLFRLKLAGNRIADASPLGELKNLVNVDVSGNPVSGVEFLRGLPRLQMASLNDIPLTDVSALTAHPKMIVLALDRTGLSDLGFVSTFPGLLELSISSNAIADLSPLSALKSLESLHAEGNPVDRADRARCPVDGAPAPLAKFCRQ